MAQTDFCRTKANLFCFVLFFLWEEIEAPVALESKPNNVITNTGAWAGLVEAYYLL